MPSFSDYAEMTLRGGNTTGENRTYESQRIVESTWYDDPNACIGYLYSCEYDDEQDKNVGLHPEKSKTKMPVDVKFIINSYQSIERDAVDYRITFKPSYECNVPYYEKLFEKKCGASYPVGLYLDLPDEKGIYRRWLIVAEANRDNRDFPNWSILFCDYDFKWVYNGKKLHCWGVGRSQSSYNAGTWRDRVFEVVENQRKFILPYNDISKTISYNQRMIISPPLEMPICWRISKVEGVNPLGIIHYTCAQDLFNPHTDVIEYDEDGNWIAAWADLNKKGNVQQDEPVDPAVVDDYAVITYSGAKPQLKVNGSYKTLNITYYNSGELITNQTPGEWSYWIDDINVNDLIQTLATDDENKIKIKFLGDEECLDKILVIRNTRDSVVAEINFEIVSL